MTEYLDIRQVDTNQKHELKLLSINEARKILGIRYEKTKQLIEEGKIKSININGRKKTTIKYINEFLESNSNTIANNNERRNNYKKTTNNLNNRFNEILERNKV